MHGRPRVHAERVEDPRRIPHTSGSDERLNDGVAERGAAKCPRKLAQLDGELGRMRSARGKGLVPPVFLIDKAIAQLTISARSAATGMPCTFPLGVVSGVLISPCASIHRTPTSPHASSRPATVPMAIE